MCGPADHPSGDPNLRFFRLYINIHGLLYYMPRVGACRLTVVDEEVSPSTDADEAVAVKAGASHQGPFVDEAVRDFSVEGL